MQKLEGMFYTTSDSWALLMLDWPMRGRVPLDLPLAPPVLQTHLKCPLPPDLVPLHLPVRRLMLKYDKGGSNGFQRMVLV